jgi:hypothetical protein
MGEIGNKLVDEPSLGQDSRNYHQGFAAQPVLVSPSQNLVERSPNLVTRLPLPDRLSPNLVERCPKSVGTTHVLVVLPPEFVKRL